MIFLEYRLCLLKPWSWSWSIILILLCMHLFTNTYSEDKIKTEDYILCRHCGFDITPGSSLVNIRSPVASSRINRSLFGVDEVFVQTLVNPHNHQFQVITVLDSSSTTSVQDWSTQHSWFPGYAWKPCKCFHCRKFLGWMFEPLELAHSKKTSVSNKGFYALVLDNLISEQYSNQLLAVPKILSIQ